jgi:cellobiose PTS system EIIB component
MGEISPYFFSIERVFMAKNIILCCANGITTTMLKKKMVEAITAKGLNMEVNAYPYMELDKYGDNAEIIFVGPQIRYNYNKIKNTYTNAKVLMVDAQVLAYTDGEKLVNIACEELGL